MFSYISLRIVSLVSNQWKNRNDMALGVPSLAIYHFLLFPNVKLDWKNRCSIIFDIWRPR